MTASRPRQTLLYSTVFGSVLFGIVVYGQLGKRPGDHQMNKSRFTIDHVRFESDKSFEEVAKAFERQLGKFDPDVRKAATEGGDTAAAKAKIAAMAGSSGFMLFGKQDHGALLRLAGQKRKAIQYVVGNPLIALQMTQHDIRASLYAPLRVLLYEKADENLHRVRQACIPIRPVRERRDRRRCRHARPQAGGSCCESA